MNGFTADWLRLREPYDAAARSRRALEPLVRWARSRPRLRVLDLGGGTGANLRFLAPRLEPRQHWTVIDRDAALLAQVTTPPSATATTEACDITRNFDWLEEHAVDLVTASALLDLVSAPWLDALLERCRSMRIALHVALTYDGTIRFDPPDAADAHIRDAVNRHQTGDKGFGPALGPAAASYLAGALGRHGYALFADESPWRLTAADRPLQKALIDGWAETLIEAEPPHADSIRTWHARRTARIDSGASVLEVGHRDVTALPDGPL